MGQLTSIILHKFFKADNNPAHFLRHVTIHAHGPTSIISMAALASRYNVGL